MLIPHTKNLIVCLVCRLICTEGGKTSRDGSAWIMTTFTKHISTMTKFSKDIIKTTAVIDEEVRLPCFVGY